MARDSERPLTPLQRWLDTQGMEYEDAAKLCAGKGRQISPAYLQQIALGYYEPGYGLAKFLSAQLTNGAVSVTELKEFPYTSRSKGTAA